MLCGLWQRRRQAQTAETAKNSNGTTASSWQSSIGFLRNTGKSGIIKYEGKRKLAIPQMKLSGYALNPQKAPDKVAAFEKALGYTLRDAETLVQDVLDHLDDEAFIEKGDAGYGMRYEQILLLTGPNGKQTNVLTAWIDDGNGGKRMTSIYVTKRRPKE